MPTIDLFLNPFLALLLICIAYISIYGKNGLTNPIAIFFIFIAIYIPLKYYFVIFMDLEFASSSIEKFGESYQTTAIINGGNLILIFLLLSGGFQLLFKFFKCKPKIIGIQIKTPIAIPTILLSVFILLLFFISNPYILILDGLAFRHFTNSMGMSYLMIAFDSLSLICIYQYLQRGKLIKLSFFLLYLLIFYFLNGRSGPIVIVGIFIFAYLFSVRRLVPIKLILFSGITLFIFALVHGTIRTGGDITDSLTQLVDGSKNNNFYINAFIERISQLEEFSTLSQLILDNKIEINPLSPLNIFTQFIPRIFWDAKPLFFNSNIMSIIYPEIFSAGVNFAFLGLGEFIYSFDIILGVIFASLVMGYLLSVCDVYLKFTKNNGGVFLFFYFIPYYYLMAGFIDGWMNTAVIPTILINIVVLTIFGRFTVSRQ